MLAKVEHWDVKQPLLNQVKHIDDSPCSAIAVIEWMNRLELMVYQCHLDQWIAHAQNSTNLVISARSCKENFNL
jgi:tRNA A37 threonylcarbamoyladenosine biosynthesis protein TsaE